MSKTERAGSMLQLKRRLARVVLDHAQLHGWGSGAVVWACGKYLASYRNRDYRMVRNGEVGVLKALGSLELPTLFDVGANRGEWTAAALAQTTSPRVHAFEIDATVAARLAARFAENERVHVNALGLSDAAGTVPIDFSPHGGNTGTTMVTDRLVATTRPLERRSARVETGDEYCLRHGIDKIDFVKVDVEGAERKVFAGFSRMLREGRISLIQFEYNSTSINCRNLLVDYFRFFEGYGYAVGKLWARGVSFGPYDYREEDFTGPNYVAVHQSCPELRRALEYHPRRLPYTNPF